MPKKWPKSLQLSTSEMLQVVCMTPPPLSHTKRKNPNLSFEHLVTAPGQAVPYPTPTSDACGPEGQIRSACCVLWKALGFIQWLLFGGFILYLHLSHSQIKLLFLLPSLYLHLSLCLPPSSLFLECFLFPWSLVSDSLCLLCGFIYPDCSSCTAWRRNTKPTLGDAFLLLSSAFLFLITLSLYLAVSRYFVILWLCKS